MHECGKRPKNDHQFIKWYYSQELGKNIYYCHYCGEELDIFKDEAVKCSHPEQPEFSKKVDK